MVDDDVVGRGTPAVESALVVGHGRIFAGLLHHLLQRVENLAVDVGIEIASEEDGSSLVQDYLLDTLRDELHRFATRDLTHMVQMRIEAVERFSRFLVDEVTPRHNTVTGGIPAP